MLNPKISLQTVEEMMVYQCHLFNNQFANQAINQWDIDGEGSFMIYIINYAARCWNEMVSQN